MCVANPPSTPPPQGVPDGTLPWFFRFISTRSKKVHKGCRGSLISWQKLSVILIQNISLIREGSTFLRRVLFVLLHGQRQSSAHHIEADQPGSYQFSHWPFSIAGDSSCASSPCRKPRHTSEKKLSLARAFCQCSEKNMFTRIFSFFHLCVWRIFLKKEKKNLSP